MAAALWRMIFPQPASSPSALFLMNEVVLNLEAQAPPPRLGAKGFRALSFKAILRMGQELYAADPLLHYGRPDQALRLAALLNAKAPTINGALFIAPGFSCAPEEVTVRLANTSLEVMLELHARQRSGLLNTVEADRHVWRRLAA